MMQFDLPASVHEYRATVRRIIADTVTDDLLMEQHRSGTFASRELGRALAAEGLIERAVPGLGEGDPIELWVLFNELEKVGAPYDALAMAVLVAGVVQHVGTDAQKAAMIPTITSGEAFCSLGYSEPDFGSDVASITTRAVRDDATGEWVIDGAKMWTTMAHEASWVILLTRTDTEVPKHRGLTMFLLPMDTPGITVQPVHTMGTERTNATFYDSVRVGDEWRLGEVNGGWNVMTVALAFERGVMGGSNAGVPLLRHAVEWARESGRLSCEQLREQIARVAIDNHVAGLLTRRAAWIAASGGLPGLEGSMAKVFATDAYQKASRWFQEAAGAEGLLQFDDPDAAAAGWIDYDARHSPVTTIYGGTSEINRNNIALRHLRLPRS
jgi:alkylation response protein AidB-like acyl-CoA dehydrogenase